MFSGVCDEILINLNPFGVYPTALIAHEKFQDCNFQDKSEENVLNHTIAQHTIHVCEFCEFKTSSEANLTEHQVTTHKRTKYTCNICNSSFNSASKLSEHMNKKHQENVFPCDHCKFKSNGLSSLDTHIAASHPANKDIDIRQLKNRSPCNFTDPSHSPDCCDRVPGPPRKYYTQKERLQNGPCRNWIESECKFFELCKFAHIAICHFQKQCRNTQSCRFFHYDASNQIFLEGRNYQKSFRLNSEDFPPLPKRRI